MLPTIGHPLSFSFFRLFPPFAWFTWNIFHKPPPNSRSRSSGIWRIGEKKKKKQDIQWQIEWSNETKQAAQI
jgi:hypothetical protein